MEVEVIAALRTAAARGVVNSRITNRAPGASTRCTLAQSASRSATFRMPNATIAPSTARVAQSEVAARRRRPGDTGRSRDLAAPARSIGSAKSAPMTRPAKPGLSRELGADVERSGAEVDVHAARLRAPSRARRSRCRRQRVVDVEAEEVIEEIVPRRDLARRCAARTRASRRPPAAARRSCLFHLGLRWTSSEKSPGQMTRRKRDSAGQVLRAGSPG